MAVITAPILKRKYSTSGRRIECDHDIKKCRRWSHSLLSDKTNHVLTRAKFAALYLNSHAASVFLKIITPFSHVVNSNDHPFFCSRKSSRKLDAFVCISSVHIMLKAENGKSETSLMNFQILRLAESGFGRYLLQEIVINQAIPKSSMFYQWGYFDRRRQVDLLLKVGTPSGF